MKTFLTALGLTAFLFVNIPIAEAITFQEVKDFLLGNKDSGEEEVISSSYLLEASALKALTGQHTLSIHHTGVDLEDEGYGQFVFEIRKGDTLWDRIENELIVNFPEMSLEDRNYTTDRILDEMRGFTVEELQGFGISSGNIDLIFPVESISFVIEIGVNGEHENL